MSPCGSTLGDGAGSAFGVAYGLFTLRGGVTCGGATMLNISASCFRGDFFLSPSVLSGLLGVGLRRVWVRSAVACDAASFDDILGNVRVAGKNFVALETLYLDVLGL